MNNETVLYQLDETVKFMMSFVLITKNDNVIVIDGGRPEDMPKLKEYVGGRHISAWILTHAHNDHISGFLSEMDRNGCGDFDIEKIYCRFPDYTPENHDVLRYDYYLEELNEMLPEYLRLHERFAAKEHIVEKGDTITVDEVRIEFLYTWHKELTSNLMNDSSLVFKVYTPNKTVLFLGDIGPEGGDVLYRESRHLLKADIVQMAHHGHMNCGMEVYAAVDPEACMWCCEEWLYNEPEVPAYLREDTDYWRDYAQSLQMGRARMYGTAVTRGWMERLGVKTHYVTKDGVNRIVL